MESTNNNTENTLVYSVHLHYIEDSYCFGCFDSIDSLVEALQKVFGTLEDNPLTEKNVQEIRSITRGENIIRVKSISNGWSISVFILAEEINTVWCSILKYI